MIECQQGFVELFKIFGFALLFQDVAVTGKLVKLLLPLLYPVKPIVRGFKRRGRLFGNRSEKALFEQGLSEREKGSEVRPAGLVGLAGRFAGFRSSAEFLEFFKNGFPCFLEALGELN